MNHVGQTTASQVNKHIGVLIGEVQFEKAALTMYADGISGELKDISIIMCNIYNGDSIESYIGRMADDGMVERLDAGRGCIEACIKRLNIINNYIDAIQDDFY